MFTESDFEDSERKMPVGFTGNGGAESADYNKYPSPIGGKQYIHLFW